MKIKVNFIADPNGEYHRIAELLCTEEELRTHLDDLHRNDLVYIVYDTDKEYNYDKVLLTPMGDFFIKFVKSEKKENTLQPRLINPQTAV